ncbi:hypothetical protein [Mesorhizobium australicum]|uniref:Glutathione S-transferase n=1 Tax=Mesorhizobium australicum TaxID=536018 RepID=A0A1X7PRH9_9HYPH|nr:hypothetical protein [Mesorhizobium australicum]SMH53920.1 hypothetical protein SAMN02982922_4966 [Mesorhizobium australicum]
MPEPVELYFRPTPNGMKIAILFEELGLDRVGAREAVGAAYRRHMS